MNSNKVSNTEQATDIEIEYEVVKTYWSNKENDFSILKGFLVGDKGESELTLLGNIQRLRRGARIICTGRYEYSEKHKEKQFRAKTIAHAPINTSEGILNYLKTAKIRGIGPKTAERIVEMFGDRTEDILDNTPSKLLRVKGIGEGGLAKIVEDWNRDRLLRGKNIYFTNLGFTMRMTRDIVKKYGDDAKEKFLENPYLMSARSSYGGIKGISFEFLDEIVVRNKLVEPDNTNRIVAAAVFVIERMQNSSGDSAIYKQRLIDEIMFTIKINRGRIEYVIGEVLNDPQSLLKGIIDGEQVVNYVQLTDTYFREINIARKINKLLESGDDFDVPESMIEGAINGKDIPYTDEQKDAIRGACKSKISIITGGPGVGKTTILRAIIGAIKGVFGEEVIFLTSPTGKAAQRMSESTGLPAQTVHRLLKYQPDKQGFERNRHNHLDQGVYVMDEASMVNLTLFEHLISALSENSKLIIVGDTDQLPSIGCGAVLNDLIVSGVIPTYRLTAIKRQENSVSQIIENAHRVNSGQTLISKKGGDFFFMRTEDDNETLEVLKKLIITALPKKYPRFGVNDIQILTPMHNGVIGTINLNKTFQPHFNKNISDSSANFRKIGNFHYYVGDRVIQNKNNYDLDIFNGDVGFITKINENFITVKFDYREVDLSAEEALDISLFYTGTIHKSQGSEFPVVIIPLSSSYNRIMSRSSIYTGITRGKSLVFVIGQDNIISRTIENTKDRIRKTYLSVKITGKW